MLSIKPVSPVSIAGRTIGLEEKPFIIAELSGNHNQSLEQALAMVRAAAAAGVDAVKLQTYTADTMTLNSDHPDFVINDQSSPWYGKSLYQLYHEAHTPWEWHQAIFEEAKRLGLIAFSSPFDSTAVEFLESLEVPAYKIASFENTDLPLIRKVANTGKPVIISTGMATAEEIGQVVTTCQEAGCMELILLKCTSNYPADPSDSNLLTIPDMQNNYACPVGLSDHTLGIGAAVASVALGCCVIEKHLILDKSTGGVDADFSLEPAEFARLVSEVKTAWKSLGYIHYGPVGNEQHSVRYRRGLYITERLKAGDLLNEANIRSLRPALGIPVSQVDAVLGRKVVRDIEPGTPLDWDMLE